MKIPVKVEVAEVGAEIRSSLYAAMQLAGESAGLVALVVGALGVVVRVALARLPLVLRVWIRVGRGYSS